MEKKNLFVTAEQIKKHSPGCGRRCVKDVSKTCQRCVKDVSERKPHRQDLRGFAPRCKPLASLSNRMARLQLAKTSVKKVPSDKASDKDQLDGERKVRRKKGAAHDPKHTTSSVKYGGSSGEAWALWLAN